MYVLLRTVPHHLPQQIGWEILSGPHTVLDTLVSVLNNLKYISFTG
jgi:hypothetical protein